MIKQYLQQYLDDMKEIGRLTERIQSVKTELYSLKSVLIDDMPKGTIADNSRREYLIDIKQCLINKYIAQQEQLHIDMLWIESIIIKIPDERHKTLMSLRYLDDRTWEYIAEHLDCDLRTVYRLHGRALQSIKCHCMSL